MFDEQKYIDAINELYRSMTSVIGASSGVVFDAGLREAHRLYEEMYPDKFTEARKLQKEIDKKKKELNVLLSDEEYDEDDY